MKPFTYYSPNLFAFGEGAEKRTGELVRRFGGTKVLLVYGGGSVKKNGAYDGVTASLNEAGIPWVEIDRVQPNPLSGKVYEGIELARKEGVDFLLGLGGGSSIDTAKAIGVGVPYDGDFWDMWSKKAPMEKSLPVGAVLTLSAAGSEGSDSCVITHENGMLKWGSPRTDVLRPVFAVMNPAFTCSLPAYQTACGAADMMAHVMERYFTHTEDVELTDRLCEALLKTMMDAAVRALADPNDIAARSDLMWAGTMAHNDSVGIGRVQDWGSHRIGQELSALFGTTHGASLSVVFPGWMEYACDRDVMRFAKFAVNVFGVEMNFFHPERTAKEGIRRLRNFFRSLGLPVTLGEIGVKEEDIPAVLAHHAKKPGGHPFGNFVKIMPEDMEAILKLCL